MTKNIFIVAVTISFFLSVYLWFTGEKDSGMFVGLWVPSLLSLAVLVTRRHV